MSNHTEGKFMSYYGESFERNSEGAPDIDGREQHSGMQNVQNLEKIINEGLRVALRTNRSRCCLSSWEKR